MHCNKQFKLIICIMSTLFLVACSNSNNVNINKFEVDKNTISKSSYDSIVEESKYTESYVEETPEYSKKDSMDMAEIYITGSDDSVEYEVLDSDIIYNGTVYKELNTIADEIESPLDRNTFINFIIKVFNSDSTEVQLTLIDLYVDNNKDKIVLENLTPEEIEQIELDEDGDGTVVNADSFLDNDETYNTLKRTYGEEIKWNLRIVDSYKDRTANLYGCSKYMMIIGLDEGITVDMNDYKVYTEESKVETTDEAVEEIEESKEGTTDEAVEDNEAVEETEESKVETEEGKVETEEGKEETTDEAVEDNDEIINNTIN